MADENLVLRYLTDLTPATSVSNADLLHINQGGNDLSLQVEQLARSLIDQTYPVGKVILLAIASNPNILFPGTRWSRAPGAGSVIRMAATDDDILKTGGADSISINSDNMPAHSHYVNITTQPYNFGTLTTESNGNHTHTATCAPGGDHDHQGGMRAPGRQWSTMGTGTDNTGQYSLNWTTINGNHTHTVNVAESGTHAHGFTLPNHSHQVTGNTNNTGSGALFSVVNKYVKLAAWYRTA